MSLPQVKTENKPKLAKHSYELLLTSFLVLFQEMVLIRWLPGQVRVLAYFPNLILISAFLGLGLGALRADKKSLFFLWPITLLLLVLSAYLMSSIIFTQNSVSEHLWLLYFDLPKNSKIVNGVVLPIILTFLLSTISFIPLGQFVANRLQIFRKYSSSLWGYSWDLIGSILGVTLFTFVSFFYLKPIVWFSITLLIAMLFFYNRLIKLIGFIAIAILILVLVTRAEKAQIYSPYYALTLRPSSYAKGTELLTNGSLHQVAMDLDKKVGSENKTNGNIRRGYRMPYRYLTNKPKKGLVLGAGTGNDVKIMLDQGVEIIDAVEIDPLIITAGKKVHPNLPYNSKKVRIHNDDARSFLNNFKEKYDLIVFGTLDSMTRLSALSNVRLDNFVYTSDCIKAASKLLTPNGGIIMYFMVGAEYIDKRLGALLIEPFNQIPIVIRKNFNLFNHIYMAGPAFDAHNGEERKSQALALKDKLPFFHIPSDNWPFLYLAKPGISKFYFQIIGIIFLITAIGIFMSSKEMRSSLKNYKTIDVEMFLFGLAFLLLESSAVTRMNLIWGATWLTSAIVFISILITILLATIIGQIAKPGWNFSYLGLVICLLAIYFIPIDYLLSSNMVTKFILSLIFIGSPIFFAGLSFAIIFAEREQVNLAFGWNLLGAVAGGLLEFASMWLGLNSLVLIALLTYLLAFFANSRSFTYRHN